MFDQIITSNEIGRGSEAYAERITRFPAEKLTTNLI